MSSTLELIQRLRVVPALVIDNPYLAGSVAEAMLRGGLPCAEVTLRTPGALEALKAMAEIDGMYAGAGTVTTPEQAQLAINAGARFIVSPGMDEAIVLECLERDVLIIPGAVTPTEIMRAQSLGVGMVKFFPCASFGGLGAIQALAGPFPSMNFLPTGGISLENLAEYLSQPNVTACGGTWMARREWLREEKYDMIASACADTMKAVGQVLR